MNERSRHTSLRGRGKIDLSAARLQLQRKRRENCHQTTESRTGFGEDDNSLMTTGHKADLPVHNTDGILYLAEAL